MRWALTLKVWDKNMINKYIFIVRDQESTISISLSGIIFFPIQFWPNVKGYTPRRNFHWQKWTELRPAVTNIYSLALAQQLFFVVKLSNRWVTSERRCWGQWEEKDNTAHLYDTSVFHHIAMHLLILCFILLLLHLRRMLLGNIGHGRMNSSH